MIIVEPVSHAWIHLSTRRRQTVWIRAPWKSRLIIGMPVDATSHHAAVIVFRAKTAASATAKVGVATSISVAAKAAADAASADGEAAAGAAIAQTSLRRRA